MICDAFPCRESNFSTTDLPLDDSSLVILVVDSGAKPHQLAVGGEYNARRESCYSAAKKMGKGSLRDATMADLEGIFYWLLKLSM